MIVVPQSLQQYLLPEEFSLQCPFCKKRFTLHQTKLARIYNRCGNCSFSVNIKNNELISLHFIFSLKGIVYDIDQYYDTPHFICSKSGEYLLYNNGLINLPEIVEFDFDNLEEQIGTLLLFS